jgi:hypothetical protein
MLSTARASRAADNLLIGCPRANQDLTLSLLEFV